MVVGAVITTRGEYGSVIRRMKHGRIICAEIPAVPAERAPTRPAPATPTAPG